MNMQIDELKQKLIKNELNYNSCACAFEKQFFFNYGYVLIHHFYKNYVVSANKDFVEFLNSSNLYKKITPLIIQNTNKVSNVEKFSVRDDDGIVDNVSDAVCLRLNKIDDLVFEIKTLLNIQ